MTAVEVLAVELFRLTEQGVRTPCHSGDEWWRSCASAAEPAIIRNRGPVGAMTTPKPKRES